MNEYIAPFVDEFYRLGVKYAVFSPGSRSTTMAMLFTEHGGFQTYMNIDERSAAFMALGIAKGHDEPVILVCTSGSAMAHYVPAILEAQYSGVPLIVLTADRPHTLQSMGAPQTIDQQKLFGHAVNYYEELAVPQEGHYYTYPRLVARKAVMKALDDKRGPVHINVPLFEPLVPELERSHFEAGYTPFKIVRRGDLQSYFDDVFIQDLAVKLRGKRVLIVAGPQVRLDEGAAIVTLGEALGATILSDPLSNVRRLGTTGIISAYDVFLKKKELWSLLEPDVIIQFGHVLISKRAQQFLNYCNNAEYIVVHPTMDYINPVGITTIHIQSSISAFCRSLINCSTTVMHVKENNGVVYSYLHRWDYLDKGIRTLLNGTIAYEPSCFEGRTIIEIQRFMPKGGQLMIANSMSIRYMDCYWSGIGDIFVYGNRGVNGIDGTVSTAIGLAQNGKPTVLITGDLAFFHDLNGLAMANENINLTIVLHNNDGGGIFEYLPQKEVKYFDYLFSTEQGLDYSGAATLYKCSYERIEKADDFAKAFKTAVASKGIHIIEVPTDKERSSQLHDAYTALNGDIEELKGYIEQF
ncbi:2-succinyl-5-enolpyruvyl-6-hydroxy-3-cyclohexene-1-carboxylic-acid synthase [Veillonella agrestimuris]|uniref:2-succinyl-5-enolpyruvyl-6-hydroxy-3- cyclohexene-1-carboxylic-acid synthase n=1 Tax=Veillonella agrestimuris TaxID=2941340 RepID=UPI00203CCC8F|nr:2-succinyl-5-enolpyruvyl-6-hydroxy-3-cyclohexene-1-carboxylic-acid synthase [Veillonella agrestimuris]